MKLILAPAKKMRHDCDSLAPAGLPQYLAKTEEILAYLQSKTYEELKQLWGCNDSIATKSCQQLEGMRLREGLTPAVLAYEGLAYQYMAPAVFEQEQFQYVQEHLRILSGFYGVLRAMDGVAPYRLEMQAKAAVGGTRNLYDFWGDLLYQAVRDESGIIVNLASKEYAKSIEKYLQPADRYITITFCEKVGGRLVTKGTYAKMARGEMVRYAAENAIEDPVHLQGFDRLGYSFREKLSSAAEFVFERVAQ